MANKNLFTQVENKALQRNVFNLSHEFKFTGNMGWLYPSMTMECIPGDKVSVNEATLMRLMPLVSPIMHKVTLTVDKYFVPFRLLWEPFYDWLMQNPGAPAFPFIFFDGGTAATYPLADYLGIPPMPGQTTLVPINATPFSAYQLIYNEYYRDQNLMPENPWELVPGSQFSGSGSTALGQSLLTLRRRAWEHDYFTSALPTAQKGGTVNIPLGDVQLKPGWDNNPDKPGFANSLGVIDDVGLVEQEVGVLTVNNNRKAYQPNGSLSVEPTSITELRRAFKLQEWLEKMYRGGGRVTEFLRNMFNTVPEDARLQRPEFLGRSVTPVTISEVLNQTGGTGRPQGDMAGHGVTLGRGNQEYYHVKEHGIIMTITSVLPETSYQQGIPKMFLKTDDPFEYYFDQFAQIGEQAIENNELFAFTPQGKDTFGYTPRYSEYKYMPNRVAGQFRTTLKHWHMGRTFANAPALNKQFIEATPTHDVFAVTDPNEHKLLFLQQHSIRANRQMAYFGTPKM